MIEYKLSEYINKTNILDFPYNDKDNSHKIINDTDMDIPIVISMSAGTYGGYNSYRYTFDDKRDPWQLESDWSGDAKGTQTQIYYRKSRYSVGYSYSSGGTINVLKDDVYIATCYGGRGSHHYYYLIEKYKNERYYREQRIDTPIRDGSGNIKGYNTHYNKWYDYKNNIPLATEREFQSSSSSGTPQQEFKITMLKSGSTLTISLGTSYGSYKGAASISWTDKTIAFGDHIDRKE